MDISRPGFEPDPSKPNMGRDEYDRKRAENGERGRQIGERARAGDPTLTDEDFAFYSANVSQAGAGSLRERWIETKERREVADLINTAGGQFDYRGGDIQLHTIEAIFNTNRLLAAILKKLYADPK